MSLAYISYRLCSSLFQGEHLLGGVVAADYSVTIGEVPCRELTFTETTIRCTPPKDPPSPPPGAPQKDGDPAMMVGEITERKELRTLD